MAVVTWVNLSSVSVSFHLSASFSVFECWIGNKFLSPPTYLSISIASIKVVQVLCSVTGAIFLQWKTLHLHSWNVCYPVIYIIFFSSINFPVSLVLVPIKYMSFHLNLSDFVPFFYDWSAFLLNHWLLWIVCILQVALV